MPRSVARVVARWLGSNVPCSTAADKLAAASRTALRAGPHQLHANSCRVDAARTTLQG